MEIGFIILAAIATLQALWIWWLLWDRKKKIQAISKRREEIRFLRYALEVLRKSIDILRNGTVVSLPCKLGDTVWYISTENPHVAFQKELRPREVKEPIEGILITADGIYISTYNVEEVKDLCDKVNEDYAYLTKEDAERAIEEKVKKGECENV